MDNNPNVDDVATGGTVRVRRHGLARYGCRWGMTVQEVGAPVDGDGGRPTLTGYQMGDRTVNYGPLMQGAGQLAGKVPFPWQRRLKEMARQFDAVGQCPQWTLARFSATSWLWICAFSIRWPTIVRTLTGYGSRRWPAMRLFM